MGVKKKEVVQYKKKPSAESLFALHALLFLSAMVKPETEHYWA